MNLGSIWEKLDKDDIKLIDHSVNKFSTLYDNHREFNRPTVITSALVTAKIYAKTDYPSNRGKLVFIGLYKARIILRCHLTYLEDLVFENLEFPNSETKIKRIERILALIQQADPP